MVNQGCFNASVAVGLENNKIFCMITNSVQVMRPVIGVHLKQLGEEVEEVSVVAAHPIFECGAHGAQHTVFVRVCV